MQDNEKKPALRFKGFTDPWEQRKLGEIAKEVVRNDPASDAPIMMITAGNGFIEQSDRYAFNNAGESLKKYILLERGELAYNHGASKLRPYGSCFALTTVEKARIPFVYHCFSVEKSNPEFLSIELNGANVENQLRKIVSSGARMDGLLNIAYSEYTEVTVQLPKKEEQDWIAKFFKQLDTLITLHQRKYEKLVNIKKSMLDKMFPKNGASVPEIRFKGFTDLWEQRKLGEIAVFSKGVGYSKNDLCEEGTPIILYGRLYTKYETCVFDVDTFVKEKAGSVYSKGGEVIVPASGETAEDISIASVVVKPGILLGGDLNIVSPTAEYDSAFLALTISSGATHKYLSSLAQGKSVVHLHNSDIQSVSAKFPTKREQEKIHLIFGKIDTLITLHQRKLEKLQNIKKSCLEKMFV